jgi:hypothetical protein
MTWRKIVENEQIDLKMTCGEAEKNAKIKIGLNRETLC